MAAGIGTILLVVVIIFVGFLVYMRKEVKKIIELTNEKIEPEAQPRGERIHDH